MLLYHGTRADAIESIMRDGLRMTPRVRPNRNRHETLARTIHLLALRMRAQYVGKPIIVT